MSLGKVFLTSLLTSGDTAQERSANLRVALDSGITKEYFYDEQEQDAFDFVLNYFENYRTMPTQQIVEVETEINLLRYQPDGDFNYWVESIRDQRVQTLALEGANDIQEAISKGRTEEVLDIISGMYQSLGTIGQRQDIKTFSDLAREVVEDHNRLQRHEITVGIPTGIPYLDQVTGGVQPGDAWVYAGRPGVGKTMLICKSALGAAYPAGVTDPEEFRMLSKKVLVCSMEMPMKQVARRNLAMHSRINATSLRLGRLNTMTIAQRIMPALEQLQAVGCEDNLVIWEGLLNVTVDDVRRRVAEVKPNLLIVDGAYMVRPRKGSFVRSHWESIMEVMLDFKQLAMDTNLPIITSYQLNRGGDKKEGVEGLAYGDSIGQLASVVVGLSNETTTGFDNSGGIEYKILDLKKGREGERGKIRILCDMRSGIFEQDSVLEGGSSSYYVDDVEHDNDVAAFDDTNDFGE